MLFEASKRCSHHLAVSNQVCTTCAIRHMLRVKSGCVHDYNNPLPGSWIHHVWGMCETDIFGHGLQMR